MSEEGIDPLNESTKNLVTTNRLLWTGINTTNSRLEDQVRKLVIVSTELKDLNHQIKELSKATVKTNVALLRHITNLIGVIRIYEDASITSQREFATSLAHTMAEMVYPITNTIDRLGYQIIDLTKVIGNLLSTSRGSGGTVGGPCEGMDCRDCPSLATCYLAPAVNERERQKGISAARAIVGGMEKSQADVGMTNEGFKPFYAQMMEIFSAFTKLQ